MSRTENKLEAILSKATQGETPAAEDIVFLLGLENGKDVEKLFAAAKSLREAHFGNKIFWIKIEIFDFNLGFGSVFFLVFVVVIFSIFVC